MKRLLLTGFEPFLHFKKNPTMEIVQALDGKTLNGYHITGRILPVDFSRSGDEILSHFDELKPDAVIALGLAGGRASITPERIAINCNDGEADNAGNQPQGEKIAQDGPDGLFSTLPIREMVEAIKGEQLPAAISNTAGTYLCNHVMYRVLHRVQQEGRMIPAGFIHIPASHEMALDSKKLPSWSQRELTHAIETAITVLP